MNLTNLSPLDGRYYEKMTDLRLILSEYGLIHFRVFVEIRWLQFLAQFANLPELPSFSTDANNVLEKIIMDFSVDDAMHIKKIEAKINHDVKSVEYFLKERIADNQELARYGEFIHFACTSEDINNLAYGLMLSAVRQKCLVPALTDMINTLKKLAHDNADCAMLARTHGQPATPTTLGKEIANVVARLQRQLDQLNNAHILGKINGATGNYNAHVAAYPGIDWRKLSEQFIVSINLTWNEYTTQIEPHDYLAEIFMTVMRINTILIDFNRDMWGYISLNYFTQNNVENEVGSSTMPHKINPIDFENAEGNLGIANALLDFMANKLPVSRWQRDLTDSTVLRNIGVALGHALLAYQSINRGLQKVVPNKKVIAEDLAQHWEILAEPLQTVMRRFGIEQPYEKLKTFTRGKKIDKIILQEFIMTLALPDAVKKQLLTLTPENYLGHAAELAKKI